MGWLYWLQNTSKAGMLLVGGQMEIGKTRAGLTDVGLPAG